MTLPHRPPQGAISERYARTRARNAAKPPRKGQHVTKSVEQLAQDLEKHLNQISCDQQMLEVTVQVLLRHLIGSSPDKERAFRRIERDVLGAIDNTQGHPEDPQGAERRKQMTKMHAEEFLAVVRESLDIAATKPDPSDVS